MRAPDTDYETTQTPELRVEPGGCGAPARARAQPVRRTRRSCTSSSRACRTAGPTSIRIASSSPPTSSHEAEVTVHFPQTRTETWPIRVVVQARGRRVASAAAVVRIAPRAGDRASSSTRSSCAAAAAPTPRCGSPTPATRAADVELVARDGDGRLGFRLDAGPRARSRRRRDARRAGGHRAAAQVVRRPGALAADGRGAGRREPRDRARHLPTALDAAALGARRAGAGVRRRRLDGEPPEPGRRPARDRA